MKKKTSKILMKAYSAFIWVLVILFVIILLIVNVKSDRSKNSRREDTITSVAESQVLQEPGFLYYTRKFIIS